MGSLAGFRRRRPQATPAAITDPAIFTAESQAIAQFGGAVAGVGVAGGELLDRRNTELARADFTAMKADTTAARNEFLRSLRTTDESYNEINKRWGAFKKKTFKTIGNTTKQRKAQKAYGNWARGITPGWDADVDNIGWGISAARGKVKVFNSAVGTLRNSPDFNIALLEAGDSIEQSKLLTSEEKDLALANAVIETNPQWYLDNVEAEGTKELFNLLSSDQKRTLETRAQSDINRIRVEQQRAAAELNNETRKTASDLWRENKFTSTWLETNRANMAASDYERYNNHLITKGEKEKKFQANLKKIEDPFNREIFGKLDAAGTVNELETLQNTVNDYASVEQKKLSVTEAKKWTDEIEAKKKALVIDKAGSFPVWSKLMDEITLVQANPTKENIDAVLRRIDRAVIPAPGEEAEITPELAISLRTRVAGIERNPAIKKRPSLTRAHAALGRLMRTQTELEEPLLFRSQRGIDLESLDAEQQLIVIENSFLRIHAELDEFADSIAGDKDFDDKINKKFQELTKPIIADAVLSTFSELMRLSEKTPLGFVAGLFGTSEEAELARLNVEILREQSEFKDATADQQQRAIDLIEAGSTVDNAVVQLEETGEQGVTATNPETGEKVISFDGGKTWRPL